MVEEDNSIVVLWSANQDSKDWKNPEVEKNCCQHYFKYRKWRYNIVSRLCIL